MKTITPVFSLILLGVFLRVFHVLHHEDASLLSRMVFRLFLPILLFRTLATTTLPSTPPVLLVLVILLPLLGVYGAVWGVTKGMKWNHPGFLASASTWSNVAILGYALGEAFDGSAGLARAAMFSAFVLPLHNVMAFWGMKRADEPHHKHRIFWNPLMVAIVAGLLFSLLPLSLSPPITVLLNQVGRASLPLALIAIGASLRFHRSSSWYLPLGVSFVKLVLLPLVAYVFGKRLGITPSWLMTTVIGFACPTAISFFVVSEKVGFPPSQGAMIVSFTTLLSPVSIGIMMTLL
ncbi:MAG: AEC family transporter [Spirochaetales bacterium]|nr:AEC family transporter [Spirochaetales bacterium]